MILGHKRLACFLKYFILAFFLSISSCIHAEIYKCTDLDGHVTYKNHKPEGLECRMLSSNAPSSAPKSNKVEPSKPIGKTTKETKKQPDRPSRFFTGTAFYVSDKLMITNAHVVSNCNHIHSKNPDAVLSIKAIDKAIDLALLETSVSTPAHVSIRKPPRKSERMYSWLAFLL